MTIDARFIASPSLQDYLVDKETGEPLSSGVLTFYSDVNRTLLKNIYTLVGSPPGYTYELLPNPLTLSSTGTPLNDQGDNVALYYFPYEGDPEDNNNSVELYYIVWTSSIPGSIPQAVRQAWPNFSLSAGNSGVDFTNYVPNGQFLIHNNIPPTDNSDPGEITQPITDIAQGGWTFERPAGSTSIDFINFQRTPVVGDSFTDIPTQNPRYSLIYTCQAPGSDAFKDICLKFNDVNKFSSDSQQFTFAFNAKTISSGDVTISLILKKNFGAGGSVATETPIENFLITASEQLFQKSFVFGSNSGKSIGVLNDDFLQLIFRAPNQGTKIAITDVLLTDGAVTVNFFPPTTNSDFITRTISGWLDVPNYDGYDLYLPPVLTPYGMKFDRSTIGSVIAQTRDDIPVGYLLMDDSQYVSSHHSSDGIPYARLRDAWFNTSTNLPKFSGKDFSILYKSVTSTSESFLHNNTGGVVSATANGSPSPGFTFTRIYEGDSPILINSYWTGNEENGNIYLILETQFPGTPTGVNNVSVPPGPSSPFFETFDLRNGSVPDSKGIPPDQSSTQYGQVLFTKGQDMSAGSGMPAYYWIFGTIDEVGATEEYYVWYLIDGEVDPAPGGIGIKVIAELTDTRQMMAQKTKWAISQFETTKIHFVSGSVVIQNSYFTFSTRKRSPSGSKDYYVWYSKDGVIGIDPSPGGTGINVNILTADTAAQVNIKTQIEINKYAFGVPDIRGYFLRGADPTFKIDKSMRFSYSDGTFTGVPGTFEYDENLDHIHNILIEEYTSGPSESISQSNTSPTNSTVAFTHSAGIYESRPKNFAVNWLVKY